MMGGREKKSVGRALRRGVALGLGLGEAKLSVSLIKQILKRG